MLAFIKKIYIYNELDGTNFGDLILIMHLCFKNFKSLLFYFPYIYIYMNNR